MKKLKNILIILFSVCAIAATVCLCAACGGDAASEYGDYRPTSSTVNPDGDGDTFSGRYVISVTSEGGLLMSGVKVSLTDSANAEVAAGISTNGTIVLSVNPGVYNVVVDTTTLPDGYSAPEDAITTSATEGAVTVILSTEIITEGTKSGMYAIGDVMYDFTLTEAVTDAQINLKTLVGSYKAVILNFYFNACQPCLQEMPALQQAYAQYSNDVRILAISDRDSKSNVASYKTSSGANIGTQLTFDFFSDSIGLVELFPVEAFPTTIVVDRYGVVAYIDSGSQPQASYWTNLFAFYVSSNYAQVNNNDDDDNDGGSTIVYEIPNVAWPGSSAISAAVAGNGFYDVTFSPEEDEEDALYSWPFLPDTDEDGSYIYPANSVTKEDGKKIHFSYAILYATVTMEIGDIISFDYSINVEDGLDYLYFLIDRDLIGRYTGNSRGWTSSGNVFFATRAGTYELAFTYLKDDADPDDDIADVVKIKNLTKTNARDVTVATDVLTAAVSGDNIEARVPVSVVAPAANDDKSYYKTSTGELLLVDILHYTTWATFRSLPKISGTLNISTSSLYSIVLDRYSNSDNTEYVMNGYDHTDIIADLYYMQLFSETGYVPVNHLVKNMLDDFAHQYNLSTGSEYDEYTWLEFCYYYNHYGEPHTGDVACYESLDPVRGSHWYNSPEVDVTGFYTNKDPSQDIISTSDDDPSQVKLNIEVLLGTSIDAGMRYQFTPKTSGVYLIKTNMTNTLNGMGANVGVFTEKDKDNLLSTYAPLNYDYFGRSLGVDVEGGEDGEGDGVYESESRYNGQVWLYYYFEADTTYCLRFGYFTAGTTGSYEAGIQYLDKDAKVLFHASGLGDGTWTNYYKYTAINVAEKNGKYIHISTDNEGQNYEGSPIYVDFLNATYLDASGRSIKDLIDAGFFDFRSFGGVNYTSAMMSLLATSISDDKSETYGLVEATLELVSVLNTLIQYRTTLEYQSSTGDSTYFWLSCCCYYQEFSATRNYSTDYLAVEE